MRRRNTHIRSYKENSPNIFLNTQPYFWKCFFKWQRLRKGFFQYRVLKGLLQEGLRSLSSQGNEVCTKHLTHSWCWVKVRGHSNTAQLPSLQAAALKPGDASAFSLSTAERSDDKPGLYASGFEFQPYHFCVMLGNLLNLSTSSCVTWR